MQQTSLIAHKINQIKLSNDSLIYLKALQKAGGQAPDYIMAEILGWDKSRVSARRNECLHKGLVQKTKEQMINPYTLMKVINWRCNI